MEREKFLTVYRHSLAHVLAKAVIEIFGRENVQYAIGPQIADGFYYDFLLPRSINKDDYTAIEDKMREILKRKEDWTVKEISRADALELFKDQKFKTELIEDLPEDEILTVYYTGDDFVDLCIGPHIENSVELLSTAFKVRAASTAYWRGDENRDLLQRIYCYAFPSKDELKAHLKLIEEAMARDHKVIGPQLGLFMFDPSAPGMPFWLPRGWTLFNTLLKFWREVHERHGYREISGPVISDKSLWETSGHWGHYKHNMFLVPPVAEDENGNMSIAEDGKFYAMKPMNCPNAILVYKHELHSYRDLPLRYSQTDVIHRREKSGELNGLFRVQMFRQDDDHTFLTEEMVADEIADILDIATELYGTFGLTYTAELSTRPDDFMGDIQIWDKAEEDLTAILDKHYGIGNYEINEGDGAFYGPKIDLAMKDALGREWQMGTVQLDFQLPLNFELKYTAQDGSQRTPVMVHRALFGSMERFIGIIIENFKGAFPFWLSPVQVGIVPIRTENNEYAQYVEEMLKENGIRTEADYTDRNMKEKIKYFKNYKTPYTIVLGNNEAEERTVSINLRGSNKQVRNVPLDKFIAMCVAMTKERTLDLMDDPEAVE
ncbi:MAG: threonine--tRNA ligase [Eubacterium sp.]|nr:threonine--tRNA ligase [Eubacterium sp.]